MLESVQKILNVEFFCRDCSWPLTGRELHLSGMACVFFPLPPYTPCCISLPFLLHFQHLLSTVLVLVSLGGPFLLGCQGLCSQCGPIRSILLSLLPESADPFQEIRVVLLWDDLEEGGCVVSGKVWAEEKSLLVERILVSQGMWHQAAPGKKGLSWYVVSQFCDSVSRTHQLSSSVVFVLKSFATIEL